MLEPAAGLGIVPPLCGLGIAVPSLASSEFNREIRTFPERVDAIMQVERYLVHGSRLAEESVSDFSRC